MIKLSEVILVFIFYALNSVPWKCKVHGAETLWFVIYPMPRKIPGAWYVYACWVNGWMGILVGKRWKDGSMDWCMDEWMDRWMDNQMDRWMNGLMDQWMDGWMNGKVEGRMDGSMDRWINGWMSGWGVGGWMDGWIDEWMDDGWDCDQELKGREELRLT